MREPYFEWQVGNNGDFWIMKVHPCGWREFIDNIGLVCSWEAQEYIDQLNYKQENKID